MVEKKWEWCDAILKQKAHKKSAQEKIELNAIFKRIDYYKDVTLR